VLVAVGYVFTFGHLGERLSQLNRRINQEEQAEQVINDLPRLYTGQVLQTGIMGLAGDIDYAKVQVRSRSGEILGNDLVAYTNSSVPTVGSTMVILISKDPHIEQPRTMGSAHWLAQAVSLQRADELIASQKAAVSQNLEYKP